MGEGELDVNVGGLACVRALRDTVRVANETLSVW